MDFFDFIKELRRGEPDVGKAAQAMKYLGWLSFFGALWNYAFYYLAPFDKAPFQLPPAFPFLALGSLLFLGLLFLYSSQAIRKMEPMGIKVGQAAISLLISLCFAFLYFIFPWKIFPFDNEQFSVIFIIFFGIFFAQFGVPAYYGIRYLGRLAAQKNTTDEGRFQPESIIKVFDKEEDQDSSKPSTKYKDALFPFGILGTFALLIAVPFIAFFAMARFGDPGKTAFLFMPTFFVIFLAPIVYNFFPSPFQKQRNTIASFTGGGSIFLFNGTWPFFLLLVYNDGLEVRVMFHRFFIPYDELGDIPEKIGFFSRGILIKSNLPGVPSGIRYQGFGMKRVLGLVNQYRNKFTRKEEKE